MSGSVIPSVLVSLLQATSPAASTPETGPSLLWSAEHAALMDGVDIEAEIPGLPPMGEAKTPLLAAVDRVAARSQEPVRTRGLLLMRMKYGIECYAPNMTPEEFEITLARTLLLPAAQVGRGLRFESALSVWAGEATLGPAGRATRASLTYSFPPDGITWFGDGPGPEPGADDPNQLNFILTAAFGHVDIGREWIRQGVAAWRKSGGLEFREVGDAGIPHDQVSTRRASVGDLRWGGILMDTGTSPGTLAANAFPSFGGDMTINLVKFTPSQFLSPDNAYRYLRNVMAHEIGHGLGYGHQVPCDDTKLMEPSLSLNFDVLQPDDRRAAGSNYGDRYAGNHTAATAHDFGVLTRPNPPHIALVERGLSTAGDAGFTNLTDEDWFRFTLSSPQVVSVAVTPTGGYYFTGNQQVRYDANGDPIPCAGDTAQLRGEEVANLSLEVRDAAGTTVLGAANANPRGQGESVIVSLPAGEYMVRVQDVGPTFHDDVQLYTLNITPGLALPKPYAIAGLHKRIQAGALCQFVGDANSESNTGGPLIYMWDLNGDGSYDIVAPRPQYVYLQSQGIVPVTLMVIDPVSSLTDTDTIMVTVVGQPPVVSSAAPSSLLRYRSYPLVITGTNFFGVTASSEIALSGDGLTITGTPQVSANGQQITGLSVAVSGQATPGPRDVTVTTPSGMHTLTDGLTVGIAQPVFTSITPSSLQPGQSAQVTIVGTDLQNTSSVVVSGTGVSVSGTPTVNAQGDRITGLTFVIAPGAAVGTRNVQVTTPGGTATGNGAFRVVSTNDLCANAIDVSASGVFTGTLAGALSDAGASCGGSGQPDLWYRYTNGDCPATLTVSTCGTHDTVAQDIGVDTVLALFSGCGGTELACNDNAAGDPCGTLDNGLLRDALITRDLQPQESVLIRLSKTAASPATLFTLRVSASTPSSFCSGAIPVTAGQTTFEGACAQAGGARWCNSTVSAPGRWFAYTATCTGPVALSMCGGSEALLSVFTGNCASLTCLASAHMLGLESCPEFNTTPLTFQATAGTTYLIAYTQFSASALDRHTLKITPGPGNAVCDNALPAFDGRAFSTSCSLDFSGAPCGPLTGRISPAAWFSYTAQCTGTVTMSTCGADFNTILSVYTGGCAGLTSVACNDNAALCATTPNASSVQFQAVAGNRYLVRVGGVGGQTGSGTLSISCDVPLGACCSGSACLQTTPEACTASGYVFKGLGEICTPSTCCAADFNASGAVTVQDIFDYLAAYFAGCTAPGVPSASCPRSADFNGSGGGGSSGITVQDIFDYLAAYFAGCT